MRNRILTVLGVSGVLGFIAFLLGVRMTRADLHISAAAEPLVCIGGQLEGAFCSAGTTFPITNAFVTTILVDILLVIVCLLATRNMKLVPTGIQNAVEALVEAFYNFVKGVDAKNVAKFLPLPMAIFLFFLIANIIALLPGFISVGQCVPKGKEESAALAMVGAAPAAAEATANPFFANWPAACYGDNFVIPYLRAPAADLNVTIAFALVAGIMIEVIGFQALGTGYLKKFFINPFKEGAIQTFVGLLELIGEFTRIISFAFRIFGNIFGGEVVLVVMAFLFPYLLPLPFYGLELFVAFIQAVIFAVLTVVFFSLAVTPHGGPGHDDAHAH
jgi:F-type H+-transporting ATPase subunit a